MIKKNPSDGDYRLGLRHWVKVVMLLAVTGALTYYGKLYHPHPTAAHEHGLLAWIVPTSAGLSSLIITGDDGIDSNAVENGLRIWVNPPKSPNILEKSNHAYYRGNALVSIGDSLDLGAIAALASMVDTGGILRILGQQYHSETHLNQAAPHLQVQAVAPGPQAWNWLGDLVSHDVHANLQFGATTRQAVLTLAWNGFRARWWGTLAEAQADSLREPLSVGVIAQCIPQGQSLPHARDPKVLSLLYCGDASLAPDSSRIAVWGDNTGAVLVEDKSRATLTAQKVHLQWNPAAE